DAHAARDGGLRGPRGEAVVVVVPSGGDVDRLRFGVGCREQLDRREGPPLPGGGGHADRLRVGVLRLLVGGPGLDVRRRARLGLGGRAAVGRRAGRDIPVHVQPGDDRKLRGGGDRHVRGAGAAQRRVAGGQGVHHGVRPALNDHAVVAGLAPPRDRHRHRAGALVPHLGHEDPCLGVVLGLNVLPHAVGQAAAGDRVDVRVVVVLVPAFDDDDLARVGGERRGGGGRRVVPALHRDVGLDQRRPHRAGGAVGRVEAGHRGQHIIEERAEDAVELVAQPGGFTARGGEPFPVVVAAALYGVVECVVAVVGVGAVILAAGDPVHGERGLEGCVPPGRGGDGYATAAD